MNRQTDEQGKVGTHQRSMLRQAQAVNQVVRESPHHAAAMTTRYLQEQTTPESDHKSLQPRQWYCYWNCIHRYGDKHHLHRCITDAEPGPETLTKGDTLKTTFCMTIISSSSCIRCTRLFPLHFVMHAVANVSGTVDSGPSHAPMHPISKESELIKYKTSTAVENAPKWTLFQF